MTAARKLNDTMAVTTVNLAVSSIGSSPFRSEGLPVPQTARFYAPLSECQVVLLLQRTIMDALRAEPNNVWRGFWVHAHDNFLPDRLFPPLKAVGFGGAPRAPAAKIEDARLG